MAVYQISKIQIRRGKANTGLGLPQLASGELGWAIDSQELFIGNGSVSEGAPAVGNTKILTTKDLSSDNGSSNLVSILENIYKSSDTSIQTGPTVSNPSIRFLTDMLDDNVYTTSFGAVGDGVTNDTYSIQRAIDQLFSNVNSRSFFNGPDNVKRRVTLRVPAGIYLITGTLFIPSYATIVGAGIDKTIFNYTGSTTAIQFISDPSTIDHNASNSVVKPRHISIEGITIQSNSITGSLMNVTDVIDSTFRDIKLSSNWATGDDTPSNIGISITSSNNLLFNNIVVVNHYYGIVVNNLVSNIDFNHGLISNTNYGIVLGYQLIDTQSGAVNIHISNFNFTDITKNGVISYIGSNNSISSCEFNNVGGDNNDPTCPQLYFENPNVLCTDIKSDRTSVLSDASSSQSYIPEISGSGSYTSPAVSVELVQPTSFTPLFRLPLRTDVNGTFIDMVSYSIDYTFSGNYFRRGTLTVSADSSDICFSDDYTCSSTITDGIILEFTATIVNYTIVISYKNFDTNSSSGRLTYSYTSKF